MFSVAMISFVLALSGDTVVPTAHSSMAISVKCQGCGCKGGPGWRIKSSGKCASHRNIAQKCGSPPQPSLCTRELFNPTVQNVPSGKTVANNLLEQQPQALDLRLTGRASVVDGDTIEIQGTRIRIWGIDAPEGQQTCSREDGKEYRCGQVAANQLATYLLKGQPVSCDRIDTDRYGRMVASCRIANGDDIASWLVRNGLALDWPLYSAGKFSKEEAAAKAQKSGVWAGAFKEPWVWRAQKRLKDGQ